MKQPTSQTPRSLRHAFHVGLPHWFAGRKRILPWRRKRTPYRVWISELMLQQTRVEQADAYFRRFISRFPSLRALASARRSEVLKAWEGLGYYARARRAHDTARLLLETANGRFPRTYGDLLALPGIGPYTAAAIGSLAMGLDLAVVDGNVSRVLSRVFAYRGDVTSQRGKRQLQAWADDLLPEGRAAVFNESMMELGALVCVPKSPRCQACPLIRVCKAHAQGHPERYPLRKRRAPVPHKTVGAGVVVNRAGKVLIAQRNEHAMLGGLWEFPGGTLEAGESIEHCVARELREELGILTRIGSHLVTVRHAFSHFTMDLHAYWARIVQGRPRALQCADHAWVEIADLDAYAFPKADLRVIEAIRKAGVPDV